MNALLRSWFLLFVFVGAGSYHYYYFSWSMSATQEVGEIFGQGSGPAHAMLRSPTVLIASVGLWGMNVFFFRLFGIDYVRVLQHDLLNNSRDSSSSVASEKSTPDSTPTHAPRKSATAVTVAYDSEEDNEEATYEGPEEPLDPTAITWWRLVVFSMSLLALLHLTVFWWIDVMGGGFIGAVLLFYSMVVALIAFPLPTTRWLRKATVLALQRAYELVNPRCSCGGIPRPVPFVDVFFADAMCSLSKVFFDWGMLLHMASHYPHPVPKEAANILIPSACAAVPFLIRARQCLIMYNVCRLKKDAHLYDHLWNALKYATSIFPLVLSAYQKTVTEELASQLDRYLIGLLVLNACYALYWDIVMDWGMMKNLSMTRHKSCGHAVLRPRLRFGVAMSFLIVLADTGLRFGWTLRFVHDLFPSGDAFVLCTQFLEVFRRALWNLLRVEWENLKQQQVQPNKEEELKAFLPSTPSLPKLK